MLRHLDADLLRANPKPFFGLSDNTNLCLYLGNLIVSYYGGTVMTMLGRDGAINPHSAESFEKALFGSGWYALRPAETFTDMSRDWADPANLEDEPEMLPGTGWRWQGSDHAVEGPLGRLPGDRRLPSAHRALPARRRGVRRQRALPETTEELPSAAYVGYFLLMCLGERGLLQRFDGLLMGRARAWPPGRATTSSSGTTTCGSRPRRCCPRWRSTARTSPSCSTSTSATPTRSRCCRTAARSGSTLPRGVGQRPLLTLAPPVSRSLASTITHTAA